MCASILFKIVFTIAWICLFHRRCVGVDQRAGDSLGPVHWFEGVQQQPARERSPRSTHSSGRDLRLQQPCTHPADPYAEHTGGYRGTGKYVESHKWSESNQKKIQSVDFSRGQFGPFKKKRDFCFNTVSNQSELAGFYEVFYYFLVTQRFVCSQHFPPLLATFIPAPPSKWFFCCHFTSENFWVWASAEIMCPQFHIQFAPVY